MNEKYILEVLQSIKSKGTYDTATPEGQKFYKTMKHLFIVNKKRNPYKTFTGMVYATGLKLSEEGETKLNELSNKHI